MIAKEVNEKKLKLCGIHHASSCFVASDDDEFNMSMANIIGLYKRKKG